MLTPELIEYLLTFSYSFIELPAEHRVNLILTLKPDGSFNEEQLALMKDWYLELTEPIPEAPKGLGMPILEHNGKKYTPVHLLTNIREGELWHPLKEYLINLKIVKEVIPNE